MTKTRLYPSAVLATALLAAACGSSEPPNCETAIRTMAKQLSADQMPTDSEVSELVATCIEQKWTGVVRTCVGNAKTPEQVASCISGREIAEGELAPRRSEAELHLDAIQKSAKTSFVELGHFPKASVGLTPNQPCCTNPRKKCTANLTDWEGVSAWDQLDFAISEDHYYQYAYESDGQTYEVRAVGDLDCDGTAVTYVMRGKIENGSPVAELIKPTNPD
jgi:hypothetical protein